MSASPIKTYASVLEAVDLPVSEATVVLASGRRVEVEATGEGDRVVVRASSGRVVLRMTVTDAGPVLEVEGAALELRASRSIALRAPDVTIAAERDLVLASGGRLEELAMERHVRVEGDDRLEAARVEVQANAGHVMLRAAGAVGIDGERIGLNDDPWPRPFAWSAIAEETKAKAGETAEEVAR